MSNIENEILNAIRENEVNRPGFYGIIAFHFQNGRLTLIRKEQTTYPQSSEEKNSNHDKRR